MTINVHCRYGLESSGPGVGLGKEITGNPGGEGGGREERRREEKEKGEGDEKEKGGGERRRKVEE